jgi:hypothetical protein
MSYVISFNDETEKFVMDGYQETFIGEHLMIIARSEGLEAEVTSAICESHALAALRANGIEIELIDIDW